jgi:hypothetical protein
MTLKPCLECGKECEILPVQLGDLFTLTYLRVCCGECMFLIAYTFMRDQAIHKQFRNTLYENQNAEDKKDRDEWVKFVSDEALIKMREDLEKNPFLLSTPLPSLISEHFKDDPNLNVGRTMRFTRPSKQDKINWAKERIARLSKELEEECKELEKLDNEKIS